MIRNEEDAQNDKYLKWRKWHHKWKTERKETAKTNFIVEQMWGRKKNEYHESRYVWVMNRRKWEEIQTDGWIKKWQEDESDKWCKKKME